MKYVAHCILQDATRQDNSRQENRVMCGVIRQDTTKIGPCRRYLYSVVRSLTTRPDFCLVVPLRVVTPAHYTIFLSVVILSCRVMCGGHKMRLFLHIHFCLFELSNIILRWLVGWLIVFNVPSTARSFKHGTPIYCPLRRP